MSQWSRFVVLMHGQPIGSFDRKPDAKRFVKEVGVGHLKVNIGWKIIDINELS